MVFKYMFSQRNILLYSLIFSVIMTFSSREIIGSQKDGVISIGYVAKDTKEF